MTKKTSLVFLTILFLYSLYCTLQLGITWDVLFHYELGKDKLDYLFSLGSNKVSEKIFGSEFYPGTYSTISAFFAQFFPRKYIIESLYLINLIFSILTVFGIYKISKELFNKKIGKITFLICFLNPIFFGHMAMNSIDTIIAFANIWFFYTVIKYLKNQNNNQKKKKYVILAGLSLGLGLGVRFSFLIILFPILFFILLEIFYFKILINKKFIKKIFFQDLIKVLIIAYFLMVLCWSNTHQNIFLLPFKLALESLSFGFGVPLILFNGQIFSAYELPKNYILINLLYKMPEFVVISFVLFPFFLFKMGTHLKKKIKGFYFKICSILFIIIFPNILLFISPWGIYDGIRLFLYLIPFISIIPAVLIFFIFKMINNIFYKLVFSLLIMFKIFFLFNFFNLTPYHYVYLNIFAGNYSENSKKFENDYWGVSTKRLISKIEKIRKKFGNNRIKIATCGVEKSAQKHYLYNLTSLNFKLVNKEEDFDFIVMNNRAIWYGKDKLNYLKKEQTCFQKYNGEDLIVVKRRGLVISKLTKILRK